VLPTLELQRSFVLKRRLIQGAAVCFGHVAATGISVLHKRPPQKLVCDGCLMPFYVDSWLWILRLKTDY
jgi:hypothetical protein